jgi:hypothetical protein
VTNRGGHGAGEELLEALRSVRRRLEPVPPAVVEQAMAAFAWRSVAASIAGLEFDSAVDDDELARVRDAGSERRLRFRGPGRVIEVVLVDNARRLAGRIEPPLAGSVMLRHSDGATSTAPVNEHGQFFFDTLRRGAFSLRNVPADRALSDFETEWVSI